MAPPLFPEVKRMKVGVRLALTLVLGLLLLIPSPAAAQAPPPLPHQFYGSIDIYSQEDMSDLHPAPTDTVISAYSGGTKRGSITTTEVGKYGGPAGADLKLMVQGDITDGSQISFQVKLAGGTEGEADQTASFESGNIEELYLTAYCPTPPSGGGAPPPTGGASPPTAEEVETNLFGTETSSPISSSGEILETIEAASEDGTLTLTIPEGTIALDKDDNPLTSLEAEVDASPPPPPEDTSIIGLAYNFGPDEATFDPPITLTRSYDPNDIPEGVAEEDLVLAWYDEAADRWVELDCVVDTENNTITASIEHFTTFAIIGAVIPPEPVEPALAPAPAAFTPSSLRLSPVEVNIGDEVTISLFVVNTGGKSGSYEVTLKIDGVVAATQEVTVSAGFSKEATFTISKDIAGTYSVDVNGLTDSFTVKEEEEEEAAAAITTPPTSPPADETSLPSSDEETSPPPSADETSLPPPTKEINWPVLWGVIGGVVVIGLLIFFLVRRETY